MPTWKDFQQHLFTLLGFLPLLTVAAIVIFIGTQFFPSWILLTRSLPQRDRANRSWQALRTLLGLLVHGLQVRSLQKVARLRIEIELLNPAPERPLGLNTANHRAAKKEWAIERKIWSDKVDEQLAALLREGEEERTIEIEECSPLLANDDIARYFDALSPQEPSFMSKVTIRSGFVAPLHLLTGVLAQYKEDWQPVVEEYGQSVIRQHDPFRYRQARKMQAFIFDCWLLWGPSTPVCTCAEWHGEVALQYGYGDENNSLSLRCSSPDVLHSLAGQTDLDRFAWRARVSGRLKWGPDLSSAGFCPAQTAIWQSDRLVLDTIGETDGVRRAGGTEAQVFAPYYSAYLWIAFVMCEVADEEPSSSSGHRAQARLKPLNPKHKWRDLIPFFIHGNIADDESYDFHATHLARGAFEAAIKFLEDETDLYLVFACAIDETACGYDMRYPVHAEKIRTKMEGFAREAKATNKDGAVLQRLELDYDPKNPFRDGDYSACALPEIVNSYYKDGNEKMFRFHELRFTRKSDRELLKTFYHDCFRPEFLDENEVEPVEQIEDYLRLKEVGWYQKNNYHVLVALDGDTPIGGSISDYLDEPNAGVIEYIVIQPEHRGAGLGRRLLEETERLLHDDADRSRNRPLDWIVAEMDDPYVTQRPTHGIDAFAVAKVWHNWKYRLLDFPYVQPALATDKEPVDTLLLSAKICAGGKFENKRKTENDGQPEEIPPASTDVEKLLHEYLRWAMRISEPKDNGIFKKMCEFLGTTKTVGLVSLSDYLGWESKARLRVNEVVNATDPELDHAIDVYTEVFKDADTAIAKDQFRKAFEPPHGLAYWTDYRYHLWTIRSDARAKCEGIASFLTMPSAGFGGYFAFRDSLRGRGMLRRLIARVEERMIRDCEPTQDDAERDGKDGIRRWPRRLVSRINEQIVGEGEHSERDGERARGWYIECDGETERNIFSRVGFWELNVKYVQPGLPGRDGIEPLTKPLHLMYKPFGRVYEPPVINTPVFLRAIREIYQSIYGIAEPDDNESFFALRESLRETTIVKTVGL